MAKLKFGIFDWVEASAHPAREVYEHKLELAAAADRAGFHAFMVAEHQGTPLSIDGSPSLLLSAMFQRTQRLRAGALTFCLPWYDPYRFYNEVCMLDHLSGGRLELGVGRGVSPIESRIFGLKSMEESRERYRRSLDMFFEACQKEKIVYNGEEVELQIKPLQKPYPPLWFPSSNREGIEFTARHGYHTAFLGKLDDARPHFDRYREVWAKHRHDPGRHNAHVAGPFLAKTQLLVVADSDAEAEKLGLQAYWKWAGHIHHLTRSRGLPDVHRNDPYAEDSAHRLVAGAPATVAARLKEVIENTSINYLLCVFSFGDLAPGHALRSLELFARDVMPAIDSLPSLE